MDPQCRLGLDGVREDDPLRRHQERREIVIVVLHFPEVPGNILDQELRRLRESIDGEGRQEKQQTNEASQRFILSVPFRFSPDNGIAVQ